METDCFNCSQNPYLSVFIYLFFIFDYLFQIQANEAGNINDENSANTRKSMDHRPARRAVVGEKVQGRVAWPP